MALIKCPECGKEISDMVKRCPNCGYKGKGQRKMVLISIGIVISIIIIGVIISVVFRTKPLTQLEKYAVDCVLDYKEKLKNPDSLQVYDIRFIDASVNNPGDVAIYLNVSGQNGFGGSNRSIVIYSVQNGKVVFGASSEDENFDNEEEYAALMLLTLYPELKDDENAQISVERVMSKVNGK